MEGHMDARILLPRDGFHEMPRQLLRLGPHALLAAETRRTGSGVEVLRLSNQEGWVDILPFMGAMIWDACFLGVHLGMRGHFHEPRPAAGILGTYGCLLYHAGLLRNGNPGPHDSHPLHGEAPCAVMDSAELVLDQDERGLLLSLVCKRDHAEGFGAHYLATHSVTIRPGDTEFDVVTTVQNLAGRPMDLMYMAHANFAFQQGACILQPAPWTPSHVRVRTAVPSHVRATPEFLALVEKLQHHPAALETLDPALCDQEQVFYLSGLRKDSEGWAHLALRQPHGDGFALSYRPVDFPHLVRWILCSPDEQVAAFALPSTCEPEGYTAELHKGHVQSVAPGETRRFPLRMGYLDAGGMAARAQLINGT